MCLEESSERNGVPGHVHVNDVRPLLLDYAKVPRRANTPNSYSSKIVDLGFCRITEARNRYVTA